MAQSNSAQKDYPGKKYQRLFDYLHSIWNGTALQSEMDDLIKIVQEDFPSQPIEQEGCRWEIKFKGKRIDKDEWVVGSLFVNKDKECFIIQPGALGFNPNGLSVCVPQPVIPESVCLMEKEEDKPNLHPVFEQILKPFTRPLPNPPGEKKDEQGQQELWEEMAELLRKAHGIDQIGLLKSRFHITRR